MEIYEEGLDDNDLSHERKNTTKTKRNLCSAGMTIDILLFRDLFQRLICVPY